MLKNLFCLGQGAALSIALLVVTTPSWSQDAATGTFVGVKALYAAAQAKPEAERLADYRNIRNLLDIIVDEHSASDLAVNIMLQQEIDGVDIAAIDAALEAAANTTEDLAATPDTKTSNDADSDKPAAFMALPDAITGAAQTPADDPQSLVTETPVPSPPVIAVLPARPERDIVRDVQTELNRVGCNAGSPDGVAGQRTNSAFDLFVKMSGVPLSQADIATEAAVAALRAETDPVCTARWAIENAPEKLAGGWGFRADCQRLLRKIRITGSMNMEQTGPGQFSGRARNSLGERGPIYATVTGNSVQTRIDFPRAPVASALVTSRRSMTLSGKDSNGCEIVAWKN